MTEPQPPISGADMNLLFGVLALQLDFIDRAQLIAALNSWVANKSKTIAQILREQETLAVDECQLLDALVQKYLERHESDPVQSLAAIRTEVSIHSELSRLADPDIGATLTQMSQHLARSQVPGGSIRTLDQPEAQLQATALRFQILRPHARGGLGQVSVALDGELNREVALKEIQTQHADEPDSRNRFLLEAEITGGLEHPGIVPVYSLGRYGDGRPFYAMRFIKGESLAEAIESFHREKTRRSASEHILALRALLRRFVDVCNAIAYAHSRDIMHRDLKPSNIMLGSFGETLVVDWGLAKAIGRHTGDGSGTKQPLLPRSGSESSPTQVGTAVGTPAFMSPEQAEGRLNDLGAGTDVYSLGATLYQLLTGGPPFCGNVEAVLRAVQKGDVLPMDAQRHGIPPALAAVCLKAMAVRRERRYATPLELAEDIEHWLADEPVVAYREPLHVRANRWMRRHRTTVATTLALLMAAAVASTTGVIWIGRKNVEIEAQRTTALQERDRAETNFKLAREAVEKTLTAVSENDRLKEINFHSLRITLLKAAVQFYEKFVQQRSDDPVLEFERGRAYYRLARLRSEMGDPIAARAELETMRGIFAKLASDYPDEPAYREQLGQSLYGLSIALADRQEAARGEALCREGLAIQQGLVQAYPTEWNYREQEAMGQLALGHLLKNQDMAAQAEAAFQQALGIQEVLVKQKPGETSILQDIAMTKISLGDLQLAQGKGADAEQTLRSALALAQTLTKQNPKVLLYRLDLAMCQNSLGRTLVAQKKLDEAGTAFRAASNIEKELTEEYPQVTAYRKELGATQVNLGDLEHARGNFTEAEAAYGAALGIRKALALANPADTALRQELASTQTTIGNLQKEAGNNRAATASYAAAVTIHKELVTDHPQVDAYRRELAFAQRLLAIQWHLDGLLGPADEAYRAVIELQRSLLITQLDSKDDRRQLANSLVLLGTLLSEEAKHQEAESCFRQALAIEAGLAATFPQTAAYREDLARSHSSLGLLLSDLGRFAEAVAEFRRALELGLASANDMIKQTEHDQTLVARLPAVLQGRDKPKDAPEAIELASFCLKPGQNFPLGALTLYRMAFAQDAKLPDDMQQQDRYNAACAAARAGTGQGSDAGKANEEVRSKARAQALAWLKQDLAYWTKLATSSKQSDKTLARANLQRWQFDADLANVRDAAIANLPANDQAAWRQLWQTVSAVLGQKD